MRHLPVKKIEMIWDGIVYRIFATGAVVGVVGVFLAAVSRKREDRIAAMAALSFFVVYTSFHLYVLMNPRVLSFEGKLTEQYRDSRVAPPLPTTCAYVFDTGRRKNEPCIWIRLPETSTMKKSWSAENIPYITNRERRLF